MAQRKPFKNHLVSITHAIRHLWLFLKSKSYDRYIPNPDFDPTCENPVNIYCIHGTADRSEGMYQLAQRLKGGLPRNIKGFHIVTFNRRARGASIQEFSQQVIQKIKDNADQRIVLMGHSRGGLIAADVGETLKQDGFVQVDAVIPLAAPFLGSYLARKPVSCFSRSVKQMEVGSGYLAQLNQRLSLNYRFFGAANDRVVKGDHFLPPTVDPQAKNVTRYDRHGHLSLLSSWRLRDDLLEFFHQLYPSTKSAETFEGISEAPLNTFDMR